MKNQILETIEKVISTEIDEVCDRYPSVYSRQDVETLLYIVKGKLNEAIKLQEEPSVDGVDGIVVKVLEDLKEVVLNQGQELELEEHVSLDLTSDFGSSYNISIEVETYRITKEYVALITDYISEYEETNRFRTEDNKQEETTN